MAPRLWTTKEVADEVCRLKNINTPYGLAKFLAIDQGTAALWLRGHRIMSDEHAQAIAPILGEDPAWLALCMAVERVKSATLSEKMRAILLAVPNRAAGVMLGLGAVAWALNGQPVLI